MCAQWGSLPVNLTGEKTGAALEQIGGHQLRLAGCDGNGANGVWGAAG